RAGPPMPAEAGSRMPLYRTVYTAIGDEGDLSRDLSTFTAHLSALKWKLEAAGPGTLALIDEIAADTDPREGAAIAVAALEKLVAAGAQVLITTHLEELKALALADPRFAPASVGFDVDRLAPTYRLRLGEVGASSAIEIARRVGLSEDGCARAPAMLGSGASVRSPAGRRVETQRSIESAVATEEREQAQASEPQAAAETAIAVGARVKHVRLGTEGVVMEVQDGSATVQMGALRSKVPVQDLVPIARKVRQA